MLIIFKVMFRCGRVAQVAHATPGRPNRCKIRTGRRPVLKPPSALPNPPPPRCLARARRQHAASIASNAVEDVSQADEIVFLHVRSPFDGSSTTALCRRDPRPAVAMSIGVRNAVWKRRVVVSQRRGKSSFLHRSGSNGHTIALRPLRMKIDRLDASPFSREMKSPSFFRFSFAITMITSPRSDRLDGLRDGVQFDGRRQAKRLKKMQKRGESVSGPP